MLEAESRRRAVVPATSYVYEPATGRLAGIEHTYAVGLSPASPSWTRYVDAFSYAYDRADRLTAWGTLLDGAASYAYDAADQLTAADRAGTAGDESYDYDANGNRTSSTLAGTLASYAYGDRFNQNRLNTDGTHTYTYDAEGNLATRAKSGEHVTYVWDHRNRLESVEYRASSGGTVTKQVDFTYDALDRRIQKVLDPDGATGSAALVAEKYVHDGDELYLQFDGTDTLAHRYIHGPAIDQILADEVLAQAAGDRFRWTLTDHEQSVRDLVDNDGEVINHKVYDSFGRVTAEADPAAAADVIFGYTGRELDAETGLQYNRARYYDSATGRFISTDPSGFGGGDTNLYRYTANSPLLYSDPSGEIANLAGRALKFATQTYNAVSDWIGTNAQSAFSFNTLVGGLSSFNQSYSTVTSSLGSFANSAASYLGGTGLRYATDADFSSYIRAVGSQALQGNANSIRGLQQDITAMNRDTVMSHAPFLGSLPDAEINRLANSIYGANAQDQQQAWESALSLIQDDLRTIQDSELKSIDAKSDAFPVGIRPLGDWSWGVEPSTIVTFSDGTEVVILRGVPDSGTIWTTAITMASGAYAFQAGAAGLTGTTALRGGGLGLAEFAALETAGTIADRSTGLPISPFLGGGVPTRSLDLAPSSVQQASTTAFRAVSEAEYQQIMRTGTFEVPPGKPGFSPMNGKWFADSPQGAIAHGDALHGPGNFRVIEADLPNNAPSLYQAPNLDGRGPSRFLEIGDLNGVTPRSTR